MAEPTLTMGTASTARDPASPSNRTVQVATIRLTAGRAIPVAILSFLDSAGASVAFCINAVTTHASRNPRSRLRAGFQRTTVPLRSLLTGVGIRERARYHVRVSEQLHVRPVGRLVV